MADLQVRLQAAVGDAYRIERELGGGGMSRLFLATEASLHRQVVIKLLPPEFASAVSTARFKQEIELAAHLQHTNILPVLTAGAKDDLLFYVMPFVSGESLRHRLTREGKLPVADAVRILHEVADALAHAHAEGVIHRDIKPENILLLGTHAVLTDFGVARALFEARSGGRLTDTGVAVGTPRYMAPEQAAGEQYIDARADVYALAVVGYEMLTGAPPFEGPTAQAVLAAHLTEPPKPINTVRPEVPPALSAAIAKALAKAPEARFHSAAEFRDATGARPAPGRGRPAVRRRGIRATADSGVAVRARPMTRLIVLPFRVLRADPDTDFLAFSLPDALTSSLSGLQSLVVRSSVTAARFRADAPDLEKLAKEADVDVALTGTLLRAGDRLRVNMQLVEAPGGTLVWSQTSEVALGDIFQLQDTLTRRIIESLSIPLSARDKRLLKHDVPATAKAYECFLRANELAQDSKTWRLARDLYQQCLKEDPRYAPAWARLGRMHRVIGKYFEQDAPESQARAEEAFRRALEINPELGLAHNLYAQLEVDIGRAEDAMVRLLRRAKGHGADPEVFAGLVHACRYCGLLAASAAAHEHALQLDPTIRTSAPHTYWLLGDYERVVSFGFAGNSYMCALSLAAIGRSAEALAELKALEARSSLVPDFVVAARALIEGKPEESGAPLKRVTLRDPEALFYAARHLAFVDEHEAALALLERVAAAKYWCYPTMIRDRWLDGLRADPRFVDLLTSIEGGYRKAAAAFVKAGGEEVLGPAAQPEV